MARKPTSLAELGITYDNLTDEFYRHDCPLEWAEAVQIMADQCRNEWNGVDRKVFVDILSNLMGAIEAILADPDDSEDDSEDDDEDYDPPEEEEEESIEDIVSRVGRED